VCGEYEEALRERLGTDLVGYDLIAFCESRGPGALQLHFSDERGSRRSGRRGGTLRLAVR